MVTTLFPIMPKNYQIMWLTFEGTSCTQSTSEAALCLVILRNILGEDNTEIRLQWKIMGFVLIFKMTF